MLQVGISDFNKMWTWLYEHPGHDQQYYMKNVIKLAEFWNNNCPLSNSDKVEKCNGCAALWNSDKGSLCTDVASPLNKWLKITGAGDADKRTYYAGRLLRLASESQQL